MQLNNNTKGENDVWTTVVRMLFYQPFHGTKQEQIQLGLSIRMLPNALFCFSFGWETLQVIFQLLVVCISSTTKHVLGELVNKQWDKIEKDLSRPHHYFLTPSNKLWEAKVQKENKQTNDRKKF